MTTLKSIITRGTRKISRIFSSRTSANAYARYREAGCTPWTALYADARAQVVREALASDEVMKGFKEGRTPGAGYGVGIDERCVEYPHVLSRLDRDAKLILDAGSALNHEYVLNASPLAGRSVHIVTLAPEDYRKMSHNVSYMYADISNLHFLRDASYDAIACISTLEHVGSDNAEFAVDVSQSSAATDPLQKEREALEEMWRLLRPGGKLFVTVPYGLGGSDAFRVYDSDGVVRLCTVLPGNPEVHYYLYTADGWRGAEPEACSDARYVSWIMEPDASRGHPPNEPDHAAAARAIACLTYTKSP